MKVTLPDGTTIEGTKEEVAPYLPPVPQRNWDGSPRVTCSHGGDVRAWEWSCETKGKSQWRPTDGR